MEQTEIFRPVFAMMALTVIVWVYMYSQRIPFILKNDLDVDQLGPAELARLSPPRAANPSDNLKNLFEMPTLFYVVCLYLFATQQVDLLYVSAAWIFVAFRVLHSAVHCTFNLIVMRFWLYCISCLMLFLMMLRGGISAFIE